MVRRADYLIVFEDGTTETVNRSTSVGNAYTHETLKHGDSVRIVAVIDTSLFTDEGMGDAFHHLQRRFAE